MLLGTLLTAQAAIVALTLAVTIFLMQGSRARVDIDDRVYREYVRRSWVWAVFWGSVFAVGVTGIVFMAESFAITDTAAVITTPGLRNITLVAVSAFFANLVLVLVLFWRAIRLAHPEHWRTIRRYVNERDVREAVQVFLTRQRRAAAAQRSDNLDFSAAFPDPGEGSANEAIRALLDDARRAIAERRQEEFTRSLDSIKELVTYAMDEIEGEDINWGIPGSQPQWPPLRELESNLYSFREEVLRRGDRDEVNELVSFDYWAVNNGMRRGCGELFTVGVAGYRRSYEIAARIGNREARERLCDQLWRDATFFFFNSVPAEVFPYIKHMVSHQGHILHDAMQSDQPADYERLHKGFDGFLRSVDRRWRVGNDGRSEAKELFEWLEQYYRVTIMGLSGRAVLLERDGKIADPSRYLGVIRDKHVRVEELGDDIAQAFARDDVRDLFQWSDWEMEGAENLEFRHVFPQKYPLTWFAIRLIELATEPLPTLDLHGNAQRILEWFKNNSSGLQANVSGLPEPTFEERCKFAMEALRTAVQKDEVAEDYEIIRYNLSEERVAAFKADVYASALEPNSIERLFERIGAILDVEGDADEVPGERSVHSFEHKGFLAELPETARIHYSRLEGNQWGRSLSEDLMRQFCEAMDEANQVIATLNTPAALLQAIDKAIDELNPKGELVIVLSGDWWELLSQIRASGPSGYEPAWQVPEVERVGDMGRYKGNPIFRGPDYEDRRVYVVEPKAWGRLVRGNTEGDHRPVVKISTISAEGAQELLEHNHDHIPTETDMSAKLRKLQICVEIVVRSGRGFSVTDPTRAQRIVGVD